jgi:hypothetical protein
VQVQLLGLLGNISLEFPPEIARVIEVAKVSNLDLVRLAWMPRSSHHG